MSRKRYTPEQIIGMLREAEVLLSQGQTRRFEHALLTGTRSADRIRASGHARRINRPDTWQHPTILQNVKLTLAKREPSTHG